MSNSQVFDNSIAWLISKTKMASALQPIVFPSYYEKLEGRKKAEREKDTNKVSMCGSDPYETREYTKYANKSTKMVHND